jgi:hypothetical protein
MALEKGRDSEVETRRRQRLAAALRENLKRRKAQQRGRDAVGASSVDGDIGGSNDHKI